MTTRNRPIVRTPRRRKVWAHKQESYDLTANNQQAFDVLDTAMADLGLNHLAGVTLMRVVGDLQLVAGSTPETSLTAWSHINLGLCWIQENVNITGGSSSIPVPNLDGLREIPWIQQWQMAAFEQNAVNQVGSALEPIEQTLKHVDVTQQRKAPTAQSKLIIAKIGGTTFQTGAVSLKVNLSFLLALP